jgi:hypothetical protein
MKPKQSPDNPHDILVDPKAWAEFEYRAGRGSRQDLADYAKRFRLMRDIEVNYDLSPSMQEAMAYLLKMKDEVANA